MPGLIVEAEKKLQEEDPNVEGNHDDDVDDSDEDDDTEDSDDDDDTEDSDDDDKEDGAEEPTMGEPLAEISMELANIKREFADIRMMVADYFQQSMLMLQALAEKASEILAQRSACPYVSHEPGPTPASTSVDSVASKADSTSPSPAPAVDAPPANRPPAFLVPAAAAAIPPIEPGDTHLPDVAA